MDFFEPIEFYKQIHDNVIQLVLPGGPSDVGYSWPGVLISFHPWFLLSEVFYNIIVQQKNAGHEASSTQIRVVVVFFSEGWGYYYDLEDSVRIVKRGASHKEFPHPRLRAMGSGS